MAAKSLPKRARAEARSKSASPAEIAERLFARKLDKEDGFTREQLRLARPFWRTAPMPAHPSSTVACPASWPPGMSHAAAYRWKTAESLTSRLQGVISSLGKRYSRRSEPSVLLGTDFGQSVRLLPTMAIQQSRASKSLRPGHRPLMPPASEETGGFGALQ